MIESVASRVRRLISATVHDLVKTAEGLAPEAVMEEAIRELDTALSDVEDEHGAARRRQYLARRRLTEEQARASELEEQAQIAIGAERADLAEAAAGELVDIEAQTPLIEAEIAEAESEVDRIGGYMAALRGRKNEMQRDLEAARRASRTGSTPQGDGRLAPDAARQAADRAGKAFDRAYRDTGGSASTGTANPEQAARLEELAALRRSEQIKARLKSMEGK